MSYIYSIIVVIISHQYVQKLIGIIEVKVYKLIILIHLEETFKSLYHR